MARIIEARVRQKAQPLAGWEASQLESLDGEMLFVRSDVDDKVIGFKVGSKNKKFSELPYPDLSVRGKANTLTSWSGMPSGVYIPTENGNYEGEIVNLSDGYQVLYWDGVIIVKIIYDRIVNVINELNSISTTEALSANQGRVLNESKEEKSNKTNSLTPSDSLYPSNNAVINYLDLFFEKTSNKSQNIDTSTSKYPSNNAVYKYVESKVKGATFGGVISENYNLDGVKTATWFFAVAGTYNIPTLGEVILSTDLSIIALDSKGLWTYEQLNISQNRDFLIYDSVSELRNMSETEKSLLTGSVVKGIQLLGYYKKGDTPNMIEYYLYTGSEVDDGGSVFVIGSIKIKHDFNLVINPLYFGCQNGGAQSQFNKTNTVYEITSVIDLKGVDITLPINSTLYFINGSFINGGFTATRNYKIDGNYKRGLANATSVNYAFPLSDTPIYLDVTDLPVNLAKYNMVANGTVDNSDNLLGILNDVWVTRMGATRPIVINFPASYRISNRPFYLFKKPVNITNINIIDLNIILYADLKFDLSAYTFRSISDIQNGDLTVRDFSPIKIVNAQSVKIIGKGRAIGTSSNNTKVVIDGGLDTINGNFFEGITVNGVDYRSTDSHEILFINFCKNVVIEGVYVKNGMSGIRASGNYVDINNCEASVIKSDNGITVSNSQNDTLLEYNRFATIKNSYAHECDDLGISMQVLNGVVENCLVENCGNNNIANLSTYGVGNSYNSGGGFSTEILSAKYPTDRKNINVTYINCVVKDCFNYGFFNDSGGVKYIGCKVINITPTYVAGLPSEFRFGTNQIRAGAAFVFGGTQTQEFASISTENCYVENASFILKSRAIGSGNFFNTTFKNITGNPLYNLDDIQNAKIISCELDQSHAFNPKYKYLDCFTKEGVNLPLKSFTTTNRPLLTLFNDGNYIGFDTTINKAIYRKNSTTYVDSSGTSV